jgi:hypothetical protein
MNFLLLGFSFVACLKGLFYISLLLLSGFVLANPKLLLSIYAKYLRFARKKKYSSDLISGIGIGFLFAILCISFVDPAHAQFFKTTETWLTGKFAGIDPTALGLVFNTLRAIFVLYLGISLVRVIAAARNDDDWQQLARIPLILVVTVTLGDLLAKLITG